MQAKRVPVTLTAAECRMMIRSCANRYHCGARGRAIIVLMWRCGLRANEVCSVQIQDVDLDNRVIRLIGKGGKMRTVGLDDGTVPIIVHWIRKRNGCSTMPATAVERGPLICTRYGGSLGRRKIWDYVRLISRRVGIYPAKNVHPHAFRHTHALELMEEGVPLNIIQQHLGHSNIATTSIYLQRLRPEQVLGAISVRQW